MFTKLIDGLIDRAQTMDFWRGLLYLVSGLGVAISPEHAQAIVSGALVISGVAHSAWHKAHPEEKK